MKPQEITKRFNIAGKSLKQAGIAFILIPIAALIIEGISTQKDISPEKLKNIGIISKFIYLLLCIVIASCLISAGKGLMGVFQKVKASIVNVDEREGSTIKIGELEILTQDLGKMKWEDAMKACADLGDGWRLPTKDELNILYENKEKIGGITNGYYWSSTEYGNDDAWEQVVSNGNQDCGNKNNSNYVRAVRDF
jgi:hypothetical protein